MPFANQQFASTSNMFYRPIKAAQISSRVLRNAHVPDDGAWARANAIMPPPNHEAPKTFKWAALIHKLVAKAANVIKNQLAVHKIRAGSKKPQ